MRQIKIEKLTLNIGAGKDTKVLEKGKLLLKHITGIEPVQTKTNKRIAGWGLRPGLPIGVKLTIRDQEMIRDLVTRFLAAKEKNVKSSWFDNNGNISFGIYEYVDIPGVKYNTDIGMLGFQVSITLARPGFRVKRRKIRKSPVGSRQRVSKDDAIEFMKDTFGVKVEE
ncbi:MAG: 50S ribosomal protein L5 [Candidatus Woesearchaeota archaeon]